MTAWHYVVIALAFIVPALAYVKKALNLEASVLAMVMVLCATIAGANYATFLLLSFVLISVVDHFCKGNLAFANKNYIKKTGTRDIIQVLVNGGVAMVSVLLWLIFKRNIFLYCFTASLIESFGDSAASDIGIAFGGKAYDIVHFKQTETGLSGGVSLAGTIGCVISCFVMGIFAFLLHISTSFSEVFLLAAAAFLGCILDSVLGSLVQRKQKCSVCGMITEKDVHCSTTTIYYSGVKWIDNDVVNMLCNIFSALIIALFLLLKGVA